ncbi:MAG: 2-oxoacid:acceptor oxidoreductase family protein [Candidatus Aquicultorales bacterium]
MFEIRWHGRGGQGVVTAAKLLAAASLKEGLHLQAFPEYGPERRGAPVQAFTRIDRWPIRVFSHIVNPDTVVVLDRTLVGKNPFTEGLKPDGVVLVNCGHSPGELREEICLQGGRAFSVDATAIAMDEIGRPIPNTPMLGALIKATGVLKPETVTTEIREAFGKRMKKELVEANIKAFERAYEEVKGDAS